MAAALGFAVLPGAAREVASGLPDPVRWVNRAAGLRLTGLRGQVVMLVFWNAASTSSVNLSAELLQLERKYPDAFVALGVHTPRYSSQRADAEVLAAARRLGMHMPVANDRDWLAWRQFRIDAWPTVVLIDTEGRVAARLVGEGRGQEIEDGLVQLRGERTAQASGTLRWEVDAPVSADGPLAFPAHALATEDRLFISDTGHHRVLECTHAGRVLRQFGSGIPGHWDGQLSACGLQMPQGLAIGGGSLYLADTGNHCVRRIRLHAGDVETVLGGGRPAYTPVEEQGNDLRALVNAPHAVAIDDDQLYVAATGQHQVLRVALARQQVETVAGDARSDTRDGIGVQSSLSQPMALALMPHQLLVADAGSNAIRRLRFGDLALTTLAGASPWDAGNRDGTGTEARFAYPCGLAVAGTRVYVADTLNGRLCRLDPYSGEVVTVEFDLPLHEPQGLSFAAGSLWLADRNAHVILRVDPERGICERVPVGE